jgi:hypothetical protein
MVIAGIILWLTRLWGWLKKPETTPWVAVVALAALFLGLFPWVRPVPVPVFTLKGELVGAHGPIRHSFPDADVFTNTCVFAKQPDESKDCWIDVPGSKDFDLCTISSVLVDPPLKEGSLFRRKHPDFFAGLATLPGLQAKVIQMASDVGSVCQLHPPEGNDWKIEVKGQAVCLLTCFKIAPK